MKKFILKIALLLFYILSFNSVKAQTDITINNLVLANSYDYVIRDGGGAVLATGTVGGMASVTLTCVTGEHLFVSHLVLVLPQKFYVHP